MKKVIILIILIANLGFAKNEKTELLVSPYAIQNNDWISAREIPIIDTKLLTKFKKEDSYNNLIMKYTNLVFDSNNFYNVNDRAVITTKLFTYNSLEDREDVFSDISTNKLIFNKNVYISDNATIHLRSNLTYGVSDSVTFNTNVIANTIKVKVYNNKEIDLPKNKAVYILGIPKSANANVILDTKVFVGGIEYKLVSKEKNDFLYYFLEPNFVSLEQKESVNLLWEQNELPKIDTPNINLNKKLREIITVITLNKDISYSSTLDLD